MTRARIDKPRGWFAIWLAGAIAVVLIVWPHSNAAAREVAPAKTKTDATQKQKPAKLRYYGGPKYPMYPG